MYKEAQVPAPTFLEYSVGCLQSEADTRLCQVKPPQTKKASAPETKGMSDETEKTMPCNPQQKALPM